MVIALDIPALFVAAGLLLTVRGSASTTAALALFASAASAVYLAYAARRTFATRLACALSSIALMSVAGVVIALVSDPVGAATAAYLGGLGLLNLGFVVGSRGASPDAGSVHGRPPTSC
jgi:hypothetical protein